MARAAILLNKRRSLLECEVATGNWGFLCEPEVAFVSLTGHLFLCVERDS